MPVVMDAIVMRSGLIVRAACHPSGALKADFYGRLLSIPISLPLPTLSLSLSLID